jgi:hypothetical protein
MPGKTLYFAEVGPNWADWVQVVNVGNAPAHVVCLARDSEGKPVWSQEKTVQPFTGWTPNMESIKTMTWMQISANQPIVAERHMHSGTNVLDFAGACPENKTVGRRMVFPELVAGAHDWFRFLNVSDQEAHLTFVVRAPDGRVSRQLSRVIPGHRWWDVDDQTFGNIQGTIEVTSTQPIVGERHLHYQGGKVSVGQIGQVLDD